MGDEYHGEDSPQDYDDEIDRLKQKITDLETKIARQNTMILELTEEREIKNRQLAEFRELVAPGTDQCRASPEPEVLR